MKMDYDAADEILRERNRESQSRTYDNLRSALSDKELMVGINAILSFFGIKQRIESSLSIAEQVSKAQSEYNIKLQSIELDDKWYENASLPMLVQKKDGNYIAVIPNALGRCQYIDKNGVLTINAFVAENLTNNAICFYRSMDDKKMTFGRFIRFIASTVTRQDILLVLVVCSAAVGAGMFMPWVNQYIFRHVVTSGDYNLIPVASLILSAILTITTMQVFQSIIMNNVLLRSNALLQSAVISRMFSLKPEFFRHIKSGELSKIIMEVTDLSNILTSRAIISIISMILSLVYLIQINLYAPSLLPFVLITTVVIIGGTSIDSYISAKAIRKRNLSVSDMSGFCYELFSGIEQVKLNGAENQMMRRWSEKFLNTAKNPAHPLIVRYMPVFLLVITIISTGVIFVLGTKLEAPDFIAFGVAYSAYLVAISSTAPAIYSAAALRSLYNLAEPVLNAEYEDSGADKQHPDKIEGNISFSNVTFSYGKDLPIVLDKLSLDIKAGECIGIVGPSGCGKSTIIRLILGFETPLKGSIYIDNYDLRELDLSYYRSLIGTVLQNSGLFSGDIFSNVSVSKPDASVDEVNKALELAGIADEIKDMPMGIRTMLGGGDNDPMSGGQIQRLLIARAILSSPEILIFDEATSALDNVTQKEIMDSINSLNCTRIIVAHRLSTIEHCDRILVMDGGRIADQGTFEELTERNELFRSLTKRQTVK